MVTILACAPNDAKFSFDTTRDFQYYRPIYYNVSLVIITVKILNFLIHIIIFLKDSQCGGPTQPIIHTAFFYKMKICFERQELPQTKVPYVGH